MEASKYQGPYQISLEELQLIPLNEIFEDETSEDENELIEDLKELFDLHNNHHEIVGPKNIDLSETIKKTEEVIDDCLLTIKEIEENNPSSISKRRKWAYRGAGTLFGGSIGSLSLFLLNPVVGAGTALLGAGMGFGVGNMMAKKIS